MMASMHGTGLSDDQVAQLRNDVDGGRASRVRIEGTQFGAGTTGIVKRVGDPAVDGEDFITVQVKVGGVSDELRFAPTELSRGRQPKAVAPPAPPPPRRASRPRRVSQAEPAPPTKPDKPARVTKPSRRSAAGAPVAITISSRNASWTVSAQRGARSVAKNAPVTPGAVSAIAALLGLPALDEAVAAVNDTARLEAEARADLLRTELAAIESVLDSHRHP